MIDGQWQMRLWGPSGAAYRVERSADFVHWETAAMVTVPDTGELALILGAANEPFLFYRAVSMP
jgi:hypothetical protein